MPGVQPVRGELRDALAAAPLKETLQFLNDGQRGFYAKLSAPQSQGSIKANDRVFVRELRENV